MRRILLVDDMVPLRRLVREFINDTDDLRVVGEAGNGIEAIEQAKALQPDLVLLDLSMPQMDGLTALPKILEVAPGARVVVLTGFVEPVAKEQALSAGASAFLEKGSDARGIINTLRSTVH